MQGAIAPDSVGTWDYLPYYLFVWDMSGVETNCDYFAPRVQKYITGPFLPVSSGRRIYYGYAPSFFLLRGKSWHLPGGMYPD